MPRREQEGARWVVATAAFGMVALTSYTVALWQSSPWNIMSRVQVDLGQRRAHVEAAPDPFDPSTQEAWAVVPPPVVSPHE